MSEAGLKRKLTTGYVIFGFLFAIKIVEYFVTVTVRAGNFIYLAILAVASAWLILYYYKHIHQLWHTGGKRE